MNLNDFLLDKTLGNLMLRLILNSAVLYIIIGRIYYRFSKKEEYLFFYVLLGIMIFLICAILGSLDVQMGLALGLFALFTIIRFRTVAFSVKDITYMILIIGISIINARANINPPVLGAVIVNTGMIITTYLLERHLQKRLMEKMEITFHKVDMLKPENRVSLLRELSMITGQNIENVNILKIDYEKSRAELEVFFREPRLRYEYEPSAGEGTIYPGNEQADGIKNPAELYDHQQ